MFIRKVISRQSTCFQIGEKRDGRFKLIRHVGCTTTSVGVETLRLQAVQTLHELESRYQLNLFTSTSIPYPIAKVSQWRITGYHRVFGKIYDQIGFPPNLLKDLVVARIVYPKSKLATIRYLKRNLGIHLKKDTVYRFLDTLNRRNLTRIAFNFVNQYHPKGISICFYDVTTLYFETTREDEFKQKGFSKDHRMDMPQIVIGLFVDSRGYPFDLEWFDGKTFEGHTFVKAMDAIQTRYQFKKLTVVADAAMLSIDNLAYLQVKKIAYIVGARLKNLSHLLTDKILTYPFTAQPIFQILIEQHRLIVDYSESRAKQDRKNRNRMLAKLKLKLQKKQIIIKRSKYLKLKGKQQVMGIDGTKITYDQQFDGLKGYYTNLEDTTPALEIVDLYHQLWQVEKAFRMSKHDLRERPIYHSQPHRIKAHLLLCFVSLLVLKEAETKLKKISCTVDKALELLGTVGQGKVRIGDLILNAESEIDSVTKSLLNLFVGH